MYVSGHLYMSDTMSLAPGFRLLDPRLPGVTIFISGSRHFQLILPVPPGARRLSSSSFTAPRERQAKNRRRASAPTRDTSGLEPSKLDIGGFHIHSGGSCDDNTSQGGHYWSDKVPACGVTTDPWTAPQGATYSTTSDGDAAPVNIMPGLSATGGVTGFTTSADESECGVAGKTVIIHREDGTRVGCGILM